MFRLREIIQAVFGFGEEKTMNYTDYIKKYDVIKAKNECGEDRYIAVELEYYNTDIEVLTTKVKRLLSFVERSPSLERKYAPALVAFGHEIMRANYDLDHLLEKYEALKKRIRASSTSRDKIVCK
tara:strand:- start:3049 stop:3423 length:375 start_codon:yes stop_codon:yes gene_type:complete